MAGVIRRDPCNGTRPRSRPRGRSGCRAACRPTGPDPFPVERVTRRQTFGQTKMPTSAGR